VNATGTGIGGRGAEGLGTFVLTWVMSQNTQTVS